MTEQNATHQTDTQAEQLVPEGYMKNRHGSLVPVERVKAIDTLRDNLVKELAKKAKELNKELTDFKALMLSEVASFIELSALEYDVKWGGKKGNVTLTSYCGNYKVERTVQDRIKFDERLLIAQQLITECTEEWMNVEEQGYMASLAAHAFTPGRGGTLSVAKVLDLRKAKVDHPKWKQAQEIIADSIYADSTVTYVRVYERVGESDKYQNISLQFSEV